MDGSYDINEGPSNNLDVAVVGVGGGGNNSVNRLSNMGIVGAKTIAVNTDREHLQNIQADTKMLIGKNQNQGLGTGGDPNLGQECAEAALGGFKKILGNADLVFITTGMGGGTGTGASPVVAEIARRSGSMVISIVTSPFSMEGNRKEIAKEGIRRIKEYSNSTIVLDNDKLLKEVPDLPMDQAFGILDSLISELIKSVTETITLPSLINLDFNDVKSILGDSGMSTMMIGESNSEHPKKVVKKASQNPYLKVDFSGARRALIHVTVGPDLSLKKINKVVNLMTSKFESDAKVILGARVDHECKNRIKLMSIIGGLGGEDKKARGLTSVM